MECPSKRCRGRMRVTRSYSAKGFQTQERLCDKCGRSMSFVVSPAKDQALTPRALMLKMKRSKR